MHTVSYVKEGKTPFLSLNEFVVKLKHFSLDSNNLYYWWEGDYIDLFENINDVGEPRGEYDSLDDSEWLSVLTNLQDYIVTPDMEDFE